MATISEYLDATLEKCGGFGRFQLLVIGNIFLGEISVAWSILMMTFGGAIPDWYCKWGNDTSILKDINSTVKSCSPPSNYSHLKCSEKVFDASLRTIVAEVSIYRLGTTNFKNKNRKCGLIVHETAIHKMTVEFKL